MKEEQKRRSWFSFHDNKLFSPDISFKKTLLKIAPSFTFNFFGKKVLAGVAGTAIVASGGALEATNQVDIFPNEPDVIVTLVQEGEGYAAILPQENADNPSILAKMFVDIQMILENQESEPAVIVVIPAELQAELIAIQERGVENEARTLQTLTQIGTILESMNTRLIALEARPTTINVDLTVLQNQIAELRAFMVSVLFPPGPPPKDNGPDSINSN